MLARIYECSSPEAQNKLPKSANAFGEAEEELSSASTGRESNAQSNKYATAADFCSIFHQHMDRLYTLAFLLTTDHELSERCFLAAFEDCVDGISIFENWALAWSRRAVVKNALEMARFKSREDSVCPRLATDGYESAGREFAQAITGLPQIERFAYVLTVLERYSDRESSVLLDLSIAEVIRARNHALQHVADALIGSEFATRFHEQLTRADFSSSTQTNGEPD